MTAQKFAVHLSEDRRLIILRLLAEMATYSSNSSVLLLALQAHGHAITRDQIKTELHWLAEQALVTNTEYGSTLVTTLTERGQDVATGTAVVPGVKRPGA